MNPSQLSVSSMNSPKIYKGKSINNKSAHSPSSVKHKPENIIINANKLNKPTENFSHYFNSLQNEKIVMNDRMKNIKEMKREIKVIVKNARKSI